MAFRWRAISTVMPPTATKSGCSTARTGISTRTTISISTRATPFTSADQRISRSSAISTATATWIWAHTRRRILFPVVERDDHTRPCQRRSSLVFPASASARWRPTWTWTGICDIGLWVPDRSGMPGNGGEWYFLMSGGQPITSRTTPFTPTPLGNDLFAQFGDQYAIPIVGNFDPPVGTASASATAATVATAAGVSKPASTATATPAAATTKAAATLSQVFGAAATVQAAASMSQTPASVTAAPTTQSATVSVPAQKVATTVVQSPSTSTRPPRSPPPLTLWVPPATMSSNSSPVPRPPPGS